MGYVKDEWLRPGYDAGRPVPVGSFPGYGTKREASATAVVRAGGGWAYGVEVGIRAIPNSSFQVDLPGGDSAIFWSGVEVSALKSDLELVFRLSKRKLRDGERPWVVASLVRPGEDAIPLGWFAAAPLRPKLQSRTEMQAQIAASLDAGGSLRELAQDPFSNDKDRWVARLNDPLRLHYERGRNVGNGWLTGSQPGEPEGVAWHFGVCQEACLREFLGPARMLVHAGKADLVRRAEKVEGELRPAAALRVRIPLAEGLDAEVAADWHGLAGRRDRNDETTLDEVMDAALAALTGEGKGAGRRG